MGARSPVARCSACQNWPTSILNQTGANIGCMDESPHFEQIADLCQTLTQSEFVWLLGWNIADGQWSRIGLEQEPARQFLLDLVGKLHGDPMQGAKQSRGRLQQRLMALRWNIFADIQQEAPFSQHAQRNMDTLLRAWMIQLDSSAPMMRHASTRFSSSH